MTLAERIEKFNNLMGDIVPPEVKKDLLDKGFFTAPASTKYHGNYEGGLFDHSYMVAHYLKKLTEECRDVYKRQLIALVHEGLALLA